jgi:hypothetical protein
MKGWNTRLAQKKEKVSSGTDTRRAQGQREFEPPSRTLVQWGHVKKTFI